MFQKEWKCQLTLQIFISLFHSISDKHNYSIVVSLTDSTFYVVLILELVGPSNRFFELQLPFYHFSTCSENQSLCFSGKLRHNLHYEETWKINRFMTSPTKLSQSIMLDRENTNLVWKKSRHFSKQFDLLCISGCSNCNESSHTLKKCPKPLKVAQALTRRLEYFNWREKLRTPCISGLQTFVDRWINF